LVKSSVLLAFLGFAVSGEDPETVEMGDVEIVHPGAVGEQLLREVWVTWVGMGEIMGHGDSF